MEKGIVVGSDQLQEWLLPWWWENYSRSNRFPVAFADFGMSDSMQKWCRERGQLIHLSPRDFAKEKDEIDPHLAELWEGRYGDRFWGARKAWFQKPLACLHSPFSRSIWIDNDCEVRKPIDALFDLPSGVAIARDAFAAACPYPIYNSGVIVFQRGALLIQEWAKQSSKMNDRFRGDQDLLSQIIWEKNMPVHELLDVYNWLKYNEINANVAICHWLGDLGKALLHTQIILKEEIK